MRQSVLKRMLVLPLILLIPVNILVIVASYGNLKAGERELILSQENYIHLIAAQAGRDIREADQDILAHLSSNTALMRLCEYGTADTADPDFYLDMMENLRMLQNFVLSQTNVAGVFLRIPAGEEFWVRGELREELPDLLPELSREMEGKAQKREFIRQDTNGYYLVSLYQRNGALLGYQLDLDAYAQQMYENAPEVSQFWAGSREAYRMLSQNSRNQLILGGGSETMDLVLAGIYRRGAFRSGISGLVYLLLALSIASVIVAPVLIYYYYRQIFQPTIALRDGMERVRSGDVDYRVPEVPFARGNEFVSLTAYFNDMLDEIRNMRVEAYEMKLRQQELQLNYLSRQIRPHFILNALNAIYTSRQEDWPQVKETILYLTRYFRYIVNARKRFVRLADEMEFLENYLKLQNQRLGKYFFYIVSWEHDLDSIQIPPLVLSTFVENSMKHALTPETRSCIAVTAERYDGRLRLKIFDGGIGFPEDILREIHGFLEDGETREGLGVGITNAIGRLRMIYGDEAEIVFRNENGALVQIDLPLAAEIREGEHVSGIDRR